MEYQKTRNSLWGLIVSLFFLALQTLCPVAAQRTPVLLGGSDFFDKAHSDTLWNGDFNLVETVGPDGSTFSSQLSHADSAQAFYDKEQNVYAVTTNPHLLDTTYVDVDKNMYVAHIASDNDAAIGANTKLFSYKISGLEKGSEFKITFTLWCLNDTKYGLGATVAPDNYQWAVAAGIDLDQYGSSSCKVKESYKIEPGKSVEVTLEGVLAPGMDFLQLDVATGYNFLTGMTIGITDLRVYGYYKPRLRSSNGIEVCQGEQNLVTLTKNFNASSYKWMKSLDDGKTWKEAGATKNMYEEINDPIVKYYCLVNGLPSDTITIKSKKCCVDDQGNAMSRLNIFYDDFGYFVDNHIYVDAKGNVITTPDEWCSHRTDVSFEMPDVMILDPVGGISESEGDNTGAYAIVVPTPNGYLRKEGGMEQATTWMSGVPSDHTIEVGGQTNGGALFLNIAPCFAGPIFSRTIDGLCSGKYLFFETYIANMSGAESFPEVTINIKNAVTGEIIEKKTAEAPAGAGWVRVAIDSLQVTAPTIILEIQSTRGLENITEYGCNDKNPWTKGNDLVIDDIKFMVCSPPAVDIISNLSSFASDTTICADTDFTIGTQTSSLLESFYKNDPYFIYQQSADGEVWQNISDIQNGKSFTFNTGDFPADTNYFRVVVASKEGLQRFIINPSEADYEDPCRDYSISKSFKIIRAGSIDMGKDQELSECGGLILELKGSNDPTLASWRWEDADGNVLVPTSSSETDKVYNYKVTDDAVLYFVGLNKELCMGRRKFTITKKKTVEFTLDSTQVCEKTTVLAKDAPTGSKFTWVYNGTKLTETGASVEFTPESGDGELKAVASATGLCESDTVSLDVTVFLTPDAPTPLMTEAQEQVKNGGNFSFSRMVTEVGNLMWSQSEEGPWTSETPKQTLNEPGSFIWYARNVSDEGCPSPSVKLTLIVNSAPKPIVRNDTVCVGTLVDFTKYIVSSNVDDGFELAWYETEEATTSSKTPTVMSAEDGTKVLEYWVSQKDKHAESDRVKISVVVAYVEKPIVEEPIITYCKGTPATELTIPTTVNDDANNIFANGIEWRVADQSELTPNTDVPGKTVYPVYAIFYHPTGLNGDLNCRSIPNQITVNVIQVDPPTVSAVNYLKSDAIENGGRFKDVMAQSNNLAAVADAGCTLVWYDENGVKLSGVPTPQYDAATTGDEVLTYYVKQIGENDCESELVPVIVTISSSPMPTTESLSYCEMQPNVPVLTATINTTGTGSDSESDYTLVWYDQDPNVLTSEADKAAIELSGAPTPSVIVTNGGTSQVYKYYVAQKRIKDGQVVVSRASVLEVTVYARPLLTTTNPAPVCEPTTVDLSSPELWKVEAAKLTVNAYYDQTETVKYPDPTNISKSGTFYVSASFDVSGYECASDKKPIDVVVDYIRGLDIDGDSRACPDNSASLKVVKTAISPSDQVVYTWSSAESGEIKTSTSENFSTKPLAGPANKRYFYNLTAEAGACKVTSPTSYMITIGDGPIAGTITLDEAGNTDSNAFIVDDLNNEIDFYSCGSDVSLSTNLTATLNDFAWTLNGSPVTGSATLSIPAGTDGQYVLSYTNGCPTSLKVNVHSVPLVVVPGATSNLLPCEGENFSTSLAVSCPENSFEIHWFQNDVEVADFANKKELEYTPATAANNGVYSYVVTNRGCTVKGDIAEGKPLKVRPKIQFDYQPIYVIRRDSLLTIPLNITVPADKAPSNVIWKESGVVFDKGASISFKVNDDHNFKVELSDDDYCDASAEIIVKKDARLNMRVSLDAEMCASDYRTLVIDTAGTGTFIYGFAAGIVVTETIESTEKTVQLTSYTLRDDGALLFDVHPATDAVYNVRYFYRQDDGPEAQQIIVNKSLKVLPPVELEAPYDRALCGDGDASVEVPLLLVSPVGTQVVWDDDNSILYGNEGSSITVNPIFDPAEATESPNYYYKIYKARGKYGNCSEVVLPVYVRVDRPLEGEIVAPEAICEGLAADIDASSYDSKTYEWKYADEEPIVDNPTSLSAVLKVAPETATNYRVDMTRGECRATDEYELLVSPNPVIVQIDSVYYNERDIMVNGTPEFTYWLDNKKDSIYTNSLITNIPYGKHTVHVMDKNGCSTQGVFVVLAPDIKIPILVSPNGDGVNDVFTSRIIQDAFPTAKISIFDRWGKKLAEFVGADEGWDGTYNGNAMPSTDYWYEIEVKELKKTYTGHFTLMRQ